MDYCSKLDTRSGGLYTNIKRQLPIEILESTDLYDWQIDIETMINLKPLKRKIYWYWEAKGQAGKSEFTKYLVVKYDALSLSGKSSDCKYGVANYKETKKYDPEIILFDIPRCHMDYINYEAIEKIKDGCFYSGKYESCMVVTNTPHIIVFANDRPDREKLSKDRWVIKELNKRVTFEPETKSLIDECYD